jgi:hypothetical protein
MVVHPFNQKISKDVSFFRIVLFARLRGFMQSDQGFLNSRSAKAEYITRVVREYHF